MPHNETKFSNLLSVEGGGGPGRCQWTFRGGRGSRKMPVNVKRGGGPGSCQWTLTEMGRGSRELPEDVKMARGVQGVASGR